MAGFRPAACQGGPRDLAQHAVTDTLRLLQGISVLAGFRRVDEPFVPVLHVSYQGEEQRLSIQQGAKLCEAHVPPEYGICFGLRWLPRILPTGIGNGKQSLITQVHPDWRFPVFVNQRLQSPFSATTHFDFPWPPNPSHIGTLVSGTRRSNGAIPRPRLGRSRLCREILALGRSPGLYGNLDRLKTQPQPQGTGDPQQRCKGGVAVFRQRLVEVAPV